MARALDLLPILIGGLGRAVRPVAGLGGFPTGEEPGLRFVLPLGLTHESARQLGHTHVPFLLLHSGSFSELGEGK